MSTNLITVTEALPDFIREMGYTDEGLADGIAIRSPKLSVTTAKEFTITKGQQTQILEQRKIRCVIVASAQTLTKAWYEKPFVPGSTEAPDCFSNDGKVPAAGVAKPQHSNCAGCPKNAFGSHPTTGRGKACGDRKLIVLVWENDPETLMTFNAPTMTLSNLAKLNSELKTANVPLQSVLVELSFDPAVTYPVVKLSAVGFVDKGTVIRLKTLADSDEVKQMLREVDYEAPTETTAGVPQNTIAFGSAGKAEPEAAVVQPDVVVDPAAAQIAALQAQLAALQKPVEPTPAELAAKQLAELQAQLAAKQEAERKQQEAAKLEAARIQQEAEAEVARKAAEAAAAKPKTEADLLQEQIAALQAQLAGGAATATTGSTASVLTGAGSATATATTQTPAEPEKPKRTRRTKEQIEADRLAEEQAKAGAAARDPASDTGPANAAPLEGEVVDDEPEQPQTGGAPDVLSLLKKWQN